MNQNPILDEIRKTREALLEAAGGTLEGLVAQLRQEERKSGRKVLTIEEMYGKHQTNRDTPSIVDVQSVAAR